MSLTTPVATLLSEILSQSGRFRLESLRPKLTRIERTMSTIREVLSDAEMQLDDEGAKTWVEELQSLLYAMEDLWDDYATYELRRKLRNGSITGLPEKLLKAVNMHTKIDDLTDRLQDLCQRRYELGFLEIGGGRSAESWQRLRPPTTSFPTESSIFGRDGDIDKMLVMLLNVENGDNNVGVISILGMPGVGKTVLAQVVYNDARVLQHFEARAWVCVSEDDDIRTVAAALLESFIGSYTNLTHLDSLQFCLNRTVRGKRFLLVLDDVIWCENFSKWDVLLSPLMNAGSVGSKIIVTTRYESVALTIATSGENGHRLDLLSDDDCWSLFKKHAYGKRVVTADPGELIRGKVVEKCKGVPLVAKTFGDMLRPKRREKWLDILSTNLWELHKDNEILTALQMSYYHLPTHLKGCFSYCAILPKGYEFEEKELVLLWTAEGLIQKSTNDKSLEDLGGEYFYELVSRSIFQRSSSNNAKFKMHDLFSDLAQMVSRNQCFRLEDDLESNRQLKASEKTRYVSYLCRRSISEVLKDALHLRTFLQVLPNDGTSDVTNVVDSYRLLRFRKLRVLFLSDLIRVPDSIGDLMLLRYLNLSGSKIRSLPNSVNSMINLQTLFLRNCFELVKLPRSMKNLINLRHFDISGASLLNAMPKGVSRWQCLQTLSNFIVGKDSGSRLDDLKHLKFISEELLISSLENVTDFESPAEFILQDKKDLKGLLLEWGDRLEEAIDGEVDVKILEMLQPHHNLEKLTVKGYGAETFSAWWTDAFLSHSAMTILVLVDCKRCTQLPSLGLLCSLKSLTIKGMRGIKSIGLEFYGEQCPNPFRALEILCLEDLEAWEDWNAVEENESFPKLQELSLVNCPSLRERLPGNLSLLKKLVISRCDQFMVPSSSIPSSCQLEIDRQVN